MGALRHGGDAFGIFDAPRNLRHELRDQGEAERATAALEEDLARIGALWADGLKRFGGPFLAGKDFSNVDAFFCPVAFRVQTYGLKLGDAAHAYVERLLALPAMQDWYKSGLAETWRIKHYEDGARAVGDVTKDLRVG